MTSKLRYAKAILHLYQNFDTTVRAYVEVMDFGEKKTKELQAWIDFHISRNHGPPTHFITLTCAENWWPDLRQIYTDLEVIAESTNQGTGKQLQSNLLRNGNQSAMKKA